MEGKIITHWPHIVGEKFASFSLPEKITFPKGKKEEGTLHIMVTSSGALLVHYIQDLILDQVNTFFGYRALIKIRMVHGFSPSEKTPFKGLALFLNKEQKEWIENQTSSVEDLELKICLEKLGESLLSS